MAILTFNNKEKLELVKVQKNTKFTHSLAGVVQVLEVFLGHIRCGFAKWALESTKKNKNK